MSASPNLVVRFVLWTVCSGINVVVQRLLVTAIRFELFFNVHVTVHSNKFLYNKTNRCTNFANLFWLKNEPLHVSGSSSAHHQEFIYCTLGTGICHTGL